MFSFLQQLRAKVALPDVVAFDHCRLPLRHFTFVGRQDPVSRLHRLALSVDPLAPKNVTAVRERFAAAVYFFVCLVQITRNLAHFGPHVRKAHRISFLQQWKDLWACMWLNNQFARHYYWRKLFLDPDRVAWLDRLEHRELNTLLDHFNRHLPFHRVANKIRFNEHCVANDLPTAAILMAWQTGGRPQFDVPGDPRADVFIKPAADFGSVGAVLIPYDRCSQRYQIGGKMLYWKDLLKEISRSYAQRTDYVLQRRLHNAEASGVFGQDDICNLRIVTGRGVNGTPELIASVMRVPSSYTTSGHDRNVIFSTIDVTTGRMGKGLFRNITLPEFTLHPDTDHEIEGREVPRWAEMVELVTRAHESYPWMPFIGWDVIDSDQGLLLLEANAYWGGDSAQLPGAPGLASTRFTEIYLEWFEHFKTAGFPRELSRKDVHAVSSVEDAA